jgi:hypothetical protein
METITIEEESRKTEFSEAPQPNLNQSYPSYSHSDHLSNSSNA